MRIIGQTASKLVIHISMEGKALVLPLSVLGLTLLGLGFLILGGEITTPLFLFLVVMGVFGLYMLYGVLQSETLTFDKTANEIRCDRKTLLGTRRWQLPLSTLQNISVATLKRQYKKASGNRGVRWSYTLKLVTRDNQAKELLYQDDGDSVNAAYQAINQFLGPLANASYSANQRDSQPSEMNPRMRVTPDYQNWRDSIFNIHPSQVGGSDNDTSRVYGVLMDVGMIDSRVSERWAISMTAFLSGEASFQPTPGSGVVGLGNDPKVAKVAQEIVQIAQTLLPDAFPIEDRALPEPSLVQFFFLTPGGVYGLADDLQKLQKTDDPLGTMLNKFGVIRQFAEQILDKR